MTTEKNSITNNIHETEVIAPGAKIAANVTVGPYSVIGENVEIGEEPSETGSVFNGAGIAAIIAAAALVLGGAGIAISKKKKK